MRLSDLQRYILTEGYQSAKPRIPRRYFAAYYDRHAPPQSVADSLTHSFERLIDKGLMIGYGRRTPRKWFIEEVRLTPAGRRTARDLLGHQDTLPLR